MFKIRGEYGERITAVDVAVQKRSALQTANTLSEKTIGEIRVSLLQLSFADVSLESSAIYFLLTCADKFMTNHGRAYEAGSSGNNDHLRPLALTTGTTITGFYAQQVSYRTLIDY